MQTKKPKILVIVGPTGSGKTALSIALAQEFAGEVISADSRQVYKGLDVGTEKVAPKEMRNVPHHLMDVSGIDNVYSAADFVCDANKAISDILSKNHLPILAGGTFFYVDSLLGRVGAPAVAPNSQLRAELQSLSVDELYESLLKLDPKRAVDIDQQNPRRLIRAIEIATKLGKVPPARAVECPYDVLLLGIEVDKVSLRARLKARAKSALERGLVEETRNLLEAGATRERLTEIGLQYPLVIDYLDGNLTEAELLQKLEEKNWQYAKRQLVWLKRDESIVWIDPYDLPTITKTVQSWLQK